MFGYAARGTACAALLSITLLFTGQAIAYDSFDAQYVTSSRDPAVLSYIVCLEREVSLTPRSMSLDQAVGAAEGKCSFEASRLSGGAGQPSTADIAGMILECGFKPGDASPDMGCGAGVGQGAAIDVTLSPRVINFGKWVEGITFDGTSIWAAESGQRTLGKAELATGRVTDHPKVGRLPLDVLPDPVGGGVITLLGTDNKIVSVSGRGAAVNIASLKACPVQMVTLGLDIFVLGQPNCKSDKSNVTRVDGKTGALTASANLGEWGQTLVAQGTNIWVGHVRGASLSILDSKNLNYGKIDLPGTEVWSLAADATSVYVGGRIAGSDDGIVSRIHAEDWGTLASFSPTELVQAMTVDNGYLIAVGVKGTIWLLSAEDLSLQRRIDLGKGEYRTHTAMVVNGALLVSAQQVSGENGAVYVVDEYLAALGLPAPAATTIGAAGTGRPTAPGTTTRPTAPGGRPTMTIQTGQPSANRGVPNSSTQRPPTVGVTQNSGTTTQVARPPGRGTGTVPGVARPGAGAPGQPQFPIDARSLGSNVRNAPASSGVKIGSTANGTTIQLLENSGVLFQGYPWFKVRIPDGTVGYQWGGGTCYLGAPIVGVKSACPGVAVAQPTGPTGVTRLTTGPNPPTGSARPGGVTRPTSTAQSGGVTRPGGPQVATGVPNTGTAGNGPDPNAFGADGEEDQGGVTNDPRIYRDYSSLNPAVADACNTANPSDTKYRDCLDAELRKTVPAGTDLRSFDNYSTLADGTPTGNGLYQSCAVTFNQNTPAYFDCLDQGVGRFRVATETDQMAPAPAAGPDPNAFGADGQEDNPEIDPRSQKPYATVSDADQQDCDVNNPVDGNYYDCMDRKEAAALANSGGASGVDLNPLHMPDGTSVPNGLFQSCAQSYGENSPEYNQCVDSGVVSMAINDLNATDPRKNDDWSELTREVLNICWGQNTPGSGPFFDCIAAGVMQAQRANAQAGDPQPQDSNDQREPGWDRDTVFFQPAYDYCIGLGLQDGSDEYGKCYYDYPNYTPPQSTQQQEPVYEDPQAGSDQNQQNDEQAIRDAAAANYPDLSDEERAGCETYGLGTQSYWDCLEAVRSSKAQAQNDQASYDSGQSSDGQDYSQTSQDGSAGVSDLISQECLAQHGDTGGQCERDVGECAAYYPDLNGSDFEACVGNKGW